MAIDMKRRMLYIPVLHIDTNLINARQKLDAVNQLERWAEEGERARVWLSIAEAPALLKRQAVAALLTQLRHRLLAGPASRAA